MKEIALEGLDDRAKDNALAEAALLAHMSHICIVKYRDSFTSKNHLYIVMEVSKPVADGLGSPQLFVCAVL